MPRRLRKILSLADFELAARKHLPRPIFGYVAGGAEDTIALRAAAPRISNGRSCRACWSMFRNARNKWSSLATPIRRRSASRRWVLVR